jgi:hypothetical protein
MTKGFAEEWLAWHDRQNAESAETGRARQLFWTRWSVLIAGAVALGEAIGCILKVFGK